MPESHLAGFQDQNANSAKDLWLAKDQNSVKTDMHMVVQHSKQVHSPKKEPKTNQVPHLYDLDLLHLDSLEKSEVQGSLQADSRLQPVVFFCTGGGAVCAERHKSPGLN